MKNSGLTPRGFVTSSAAVAAGVLPGLSTPTPSSVTAALKVVCVGGHPDDHTAPVLEQKKNALFAHVSQDGQGIWREHHEIMAQWRGREIGLHAAEAFVHLNRDHQGSELPGL